MALYAGFLIGRLKEQTMENMGNKEQKRADMHLTGNKRDTKVTHTRENKTTNEKLWQETRQGCGQ